MVRDKRSRCIQKSVLTAIGLYVCLFIYYVYFGLSHPYIGIQVELEGEHYYIQSVENVSLQQAYPIGQGQKVRQVNHSPVYEHHTIKWDIIEMASHILIEKDNGDLLVLETSSFITWKNYTRVLVLAFTSLVFVVTGATTYFKSNNHSVKILMFGLNYLIAISLISSISSGVWHIPSIISLIVVLPFIPMLLIALFLKFPMPTSRPVFVWINRLLLIVALCSTSLYVIDLLFFDARNYFSFSRFIMLLFISGMILFLLLLVIRNATSKDSFSKNQYRILNFSIIVSILPITLLNIFPTFLEVLPKVSVPFVFLLIPLNLLPIVFAYLIIKNKIIDINLYLPKIVSIVIIIFGSLAFYYIWQQTIHWMVTDEEMLKLMHPLGIMLAICATLIGHRTIPSIVLNKLFGYKDHLKQHKNDLMLKLVRNEHIDSILEFILSSLHQVISIHSSFIFIRKDGERVRWKATGEYSVIGQKMVQWLQQESECTDTSLTHQLDKSHCATHHYEDVFVVTLVIGPKLNGSRLEEAEIRNINEFLEISTEVIYSAIHIKQLEQEKLFLDQSKNMVQSELNQYKLFNEYLMEAQEEERKSLSMYLHDHILQNVISLGHNLETTIQAIQSNHYVCSKDGINSALRTAHKVVEDIREKCFDLYPAMIEDIGLLKTCDYFFYKELNGKELNIRLDFHVTEKDISTLSQSVQNIIFRSLKEAVMNALKHAQASLISIRITKDNNDLIFEVSDNGKGFSTNALHMNDLLHKKHMGLATVKQNIDKAGGLFDIYSSKEAGTTITLHFSKHVNGGVFNESYQSAHSG